MCCFSPIRRRSAIAFYEAAQFPRAYKGDAFVTLQGSWNRAKRTGYKVVRLLFKDGKPTGEYEDFLAGFVADDAGVWGRPIGVAVARDGALIVSDEGGDVDLAGCLQEAVSRAPRAGARRRDGWNAAPSCKGQTSTAPGGVNFQLTRTKHEHMIARRRRRRLRCSSNDISAWLTGPAVEFGATATVFWSARHRSLSGPTVRMAETKWRPRPLADLNCDFGEAYGLPVEFGAKIGGLDGGRPSA